MIFHFFILISIQKAYSSCQKGSIGDYCDECGISSKPNVRIVGGKTAVPHSWPSIALIGFRYKLDVHLKDEFYSENFHSYCGGTLIDRKTILTAAHCFIKEVNFKIKKTDYTMPVKPNIYYPTYESMYTVYLGMHNITGAIDGKSNINPGSPFNIDKFMIHPGYNDDFFLNDIALIKLRNEVKLNDNIQIACLPSNDYKLRLNTSAWVIGWGSVRMGGNFSPLLQNVKIRIYAESHCKNVPPALKNWKSQICAGEDQGGKDSCQGDSGGPLMVKGLVNGIQRYVLVGITSYGFSCGLPGYPGIYTRVTAFLDWINSTSSLEYAINPVTTTKIYKTLLPSPPKCSRPNCNECGQTFAKPNLKIIGGKEANEHSWPSMVLIVFNYTFDYNTTKEILEITKIRTCCGTLIDNRTVITTSNCYIEDVEVFDLDKNIFDRIPVKINEYHKTIESMYTVYLGLHDIKSIRNVNIQKPVIKASIQKFIRHPRYNSSNNLNDIALIKLDREVEFNQYIQPACLPRITNFPRKVNVSTWAIGWGSITFYSNISQKLQNVKMMLYDGKFCQNVHPNVDKDWKRQICSGVLQGGKDTCEGDAGGPLFVKIRVNGKIKFILAGLTSYGQGCGRPGLPGIYTRVSSYLRWIRNNLKPVKKILTGSRLLKNESTLKLDTKFNNCKYGRVGKYCDVCGRHFARSSRILGGSEAKPHSWPSTVLIRFNYSYFYTYNNVTNQYQKAGFCSGNLIDRRTIITVAHCFFKRFPLRNKDGAKKIV